MSGPKTSYVSVNTQQQAALARQQREEMARRQQAELAEMRERELRYQQEEMSRMIQEGARRGDLLNQLRSQLADMKKLIAEIESCRKYPWFSDIQIRESQPVVQEAERILKKYENAPARKTSYKLAKDNGVLSDVIRNLEPSISRIRETARTYSRAAGGVQAGPKNAGDSRLNTIRQQAETLAALLAQMGPDSPGAEEGRRQLREMKEMLERLSKTQAQGTPDNEQIERLRKQLEENLTRARQTLDQAARVRAQQLDAGFNLSFASRAPERKPAETIKKDTFDDARYEQIMDALDELEKFHLSGDLLSELQDLRMEAEQIRDNAYLENFHLAVLKPFIRRCKKEEEVRKTYDDLLLKCRILAEAGGFEVTEPDVTREGIEFLEEQARRLEKADLARREKEYIDQAVDEAMREMGYELVGDRTVVKKNGRMVRHELYSLNEGTAVDVTYGADGQISMELGGLDTEDREPTHGESAQLVEEMRQFCTHYETLARRLARQGIEMRHMQLLPPEAEYAQIINISDYHMTRQDVEGFSAGRQRKASQQMHRTRE